MKKCIEGWWVYGVGRYGGGGEGEVLFSVGSGGGGDREGMFGEMVGKGYVVYEMREDVYWFR